MTTSELPPSLTHFRSQLQRAIELEIELTHEFDSEPVSARRARRRPVLAGAGIAALAGIAATVVLILSATTGTTPAYAVTANPSGGYTVELFDLTNGIPALNAKLASLGIDETVIPVTSDCTSQILFGGSAAGAETVTLTPGRAHLDPGYDGYLAAIPIGNGQVELAMGAMQPPLPTCLSADSPRFDPTPIATTGGTPTYTVTTP